MSASIPGAKRYFRRSLHVRDATYNDDSISKKKKNLKSFFFLISKKGGGPLIRACSLIRSNTVVIEHIKINDLVEAG